LLHEVRYPYFDRDFLEFMYAIPREQIVRVGQRRSLMKRALERIVPNEVLSRRRRTFASAEPTNESPREWPSLREIGQQVAASSVGLIDPDLFGEALQKARHNEEVSTEYLKRTLTLESWLRHLTIRGVLTDPTPLRKEICTSDLEAKELVAPPQPRV